MGTSLATLVVAKKGKNKRVATAKSGHLFRERIVSMLFMTDLLVSKINIVLSITGNPRAARRSWVLRGVAESVAEEARTRGFASLTFVRFAFIARSILRLC
jgi:hypothetical protein